MGRRVGMMFTILSAGAVSGPPISGAIGTATGGFGTVGVYAGSFLTASLGDVHPRCRKRDYSGCGTDVMESVPRTS